MTSLFRNGTLRCDMRRNLSKTVLLTIERYRIGADGTLGCLLVQFCCSDMQPFFFCTLSSAGQSCRPITDWSKVRALQGPLYMEEYPSG